MTKLLRLASEIMAAQVISTKKKVIAKKKGYCLPNTEDGQSTGEIGVDLQRIIMSLRLQLESAGPYGSSYAPIFLNLNRLASPIIKVGKRLWTTRITCCGLRLRTSGLDILGFFTLVVTAK